MSGNHHLQTGNETEEPTAAAAVVTMKSSSPFQFLLEAAQGLHALSKNTVSDHETTNNNATITASSSSSEDPRPEQQYLPTQNPLQGECSWGPLSPKNNQNRKRKSPTNETLLVVQDNNLPSCDASSSSTASAAESAVQQRETVSVTKKKKRKRQVAPKHDEKWMNRYQQLVHYHKEHGNCLVPQKESGNKALGSWVMNQRKQYKLYKEGRTTSMTQGRIDLLDRLNFEFDPHKDLWMKRYNELRVYKKDFGDCMVPYKYDVNAKLGLWVDKQRRQYRCFKKGQQSFMTQARVDLLNKLGFCWEPLEVNQLKPDEATTSACISEGTGLATTEYYSKLMPTAEETTSLSAPATTAQHEQVSSSSSSSVPQQDATSWLQHYGELEKYHAANGDCKVTANDPENRCLFDWVSEQRNQYKHLQQKRDESILTPERVFLLERLGFEWEPCKKSDWGERYEELVEYRAKFGTASVRENSNDYPKLAEWLVIQKAQYKLFKEHKPSTLTMDRIEKLEQLGIEWGPLESSWNFRYKQLLAFKDAHGHCQVSASHREHIDLARWVDEQRAQWRLFQQQGTSTIITEERIGLLDSIGFVFEPLEAEWMESLKQFKECNNVTIRLEQNPQLVEWVDTQRQQFKLYKDGKPSRMTAKRIELLEAMNFDWNPQETEWLARLAELRDYVKLHGYGRTPLREENPGLCQWVDAQRKDYQKTKEVSNQNNCDDQRDANDENDNQLQRTPLKETRIAMLDALGFPWVAPASSTPQKSQSQCNYYHPHHGWHPSKPDSVPPPPPMHPSHYPYHNWEYQYNQYHVTGSPNPNQQQPAPPPPPQYHQLGSPSPSWEHYHSLPPQHHYNY